MLTGEEQQGERERARPHATPRSRTLGQSRCRWQAATTAAARDTVRACVMCTTLLCTRISNVASARSSMLESPASPMCIALGQGWRVSRRLGRPCARSGAGPRGQTWAMRTERKQGCAARLAMADCQSAADCGRPSRRSIRRLPVSPCCFLLRPTSACHSRCVVPPLTRCQPTNPPPRAPAHGHAHNEDASVPSTASAFQEGPGRQRGWEA